MQLYITTVLNFNRCL